MPSFLTPIWKRGPAAKIFGSGDERSSGFTTGGPLAAGLPFLSWRGFVPLVPPPRAPEVAKDLRRYSLGDDAVHGWVTQFRPPMKKRRLEIDRKTDTDEERTRALLKVHTLIDLAGSACALFERYEAASAEARMSLLKHVFADKATSTILKRAGSALQFGR